VILKYLQIAISFINIISNRIYYYSGYIDQLNKDLNYKINIISSKLSNPFIIFIINKDLKKNTNDNKEKGGGGDNQDRNL